MIIFAFQIYNGSIKISSKDVQLDDGKLENFLDRYKKIPQKQRKDDYGDIYFTGKDPISDEYVAVKGNFSSILNGDDLLIFGTSM